MSVHSIVLTFVTAVIVTATLTGCTSATKQTTQEISESSDSSVNFPTDIQPSVITRTNDAENQVLIRLVRYLEELDALVNEAEYKSNPDSRIHFDYRQLRTDLLSISHGIRTHLRTPNYSPRTVLPVQGNYRE